MKTPPIFYILALCALLFTACKKDPQTKVTKEIFSGYAQKGPFVNGSSIILSELRENLDQTGKTYSTIISDNSGSFEEQNIELISRYVELKAEGFYFNEISGQLSSAPITLSALIDIEDMNSANVNILTHLEKQRVEYLIKQQGMSFSTAKQQAQQEVLAIFGFEPSATPSEALDVTIDPKLLAISCILQGYLSTGDMMELLANINTDIKQDGKLDNIALGSKLMGNAYAIQFSLSEIRNNLIKKYTELGVNVTIPDFENYIESFINSNLYPQTVSIKYPATGSHGVNILSDGVSEVKEQSYCSMSAEVPLGLSLKIILKGDGWWCSLGNIINWTPSSNYSVFTVTESGKISDLLLVPFILDPNQSVVNIEFYENGATTPTKTKLLHINK